MTTSTHAPIPAPSSVLLTVAQFAGTQPALSEASIRWALFHRRTNGLEASGAVVQLGRRVLIDPDQYMAWLRTSPAVCPHPSPRRPRAVPILDQTGA